MDIVALASGVAEWPGYPHAPFPEQRMPSQLDTHADMEHALSHNVVHSLQKRVNKFSGAAQTLRRVGWFAVV